jgi:DNA-binding MarR family transcriptional regulator
MRGGGFTEPTYTQVPNDLFAALPHLTDPQIRCLLIITRWTLGYHRTTCTASLTDIQRETGLSRPSVIAALMQLHEGGLITRTHRYPRSTWRLNITNETRINLAATPRTRREQNKLL